MNLIKERNQTTVESVGISDFLQQLKDLPDWAFRIVIDEMRKQNMITKEELRAVVKEIKRRKEISVPTVPRQGSMTVKDVWSRSGVTQSGANYSGVEGS